MLALLALAVLDPAPAGRPEALAPEEPGWSFELAPYYWSASLSGSLAIDGEEVDVEDGGDGGLGPPTLLGYLGHFEARHGPWSYGFAPMFINASDMQGGQPPATDANVTIRAQVHEAFVARDFAAGWQWLVGARYQDLETDMDLSVGGVPSSSHEGSKSWVDPIVGARYTAQLGEDWRVRARADIGGFGVGSDFVWNASALAEYKFTKLFGMYAGYRALSFDFSDGSGSGRVSYDLSMFGPIIGLSFSF